jgi:Mn2+/Fe2+ NRAMP family transporter
MNILLELSLGILTAMGGFIDIGELVFNIRAGALYGLDLLWAIVIGLIIIITFSEMSGRVACVTKKPVTLLMRERLGFTLGSCAIVISVIVNVITCSAELGGVALVLHLLSGFPYTLMIPVAVVLFAAIIWLLSFTTIERVFGLLGLFMVTFIVIFVQFHPDWKAVLSNLIPHVPHLTDTNNYVLYAYFAVGLISATIMPYEVFFYSSGGIEEKWTSKDLKENVSTSVFGFTLGSLLSIALIGIGALFFMPRGIDPQLLDSALLGPMHIFGSIGITLALIGVFFALGGATIETALSTAFNITQFFGWKWGKEEKPQHVPRFTFSWLGVLGIALIILLFGVNPITLTEYAVIFSVVILPFTYLPILLVSSDKKEMGKNVNTKVLTIFGWILLILITVIAVAAIPLTLLTHMGQG